MYIPISHPAAFAAIRGGGVGGMVHFYDTEDGVLVTADIHGLPENEAGFFAFHIHEGASCGEPGGHYDPEKTPHPRHAGDLPPLLSNGGRAYMAVLTDRFRAGEVIGRTVIIHANADDFRTQPSGDPGRIVACGVIRGAGDKKQGMKLVQDAQTAGNLKKKNRESS